MEVINTMPTKDPKIYKQQKTCRVLNIHHVYYLILLRFPVGYFPRPDQCTPLVFQLQLTQIMYILGKQIYKQIAIVFHVFTRF